MVGTKLVAKGTQNVKKFKVNRFQVRYSNKSRHPNFCRNDIRNALTGSSIINDIINTVEYINKNNTVSVLIITGEGKAFLLEVILKKCLKNTFLTSRGGKKIPLWYTTNNLYMKK